MKKSLKKGGVNRRIKSTTRERSRSRSHSKLRRTKSHRSIPSGTLIRYIDRNGNVSQLPRGDLNCIGNNYDESQGNCFTGPLSLACLTKDNAVQNPLNNKKCYNREFICNWLENKEDDVGDDPENRGNYPSGWRNKNCYKSKRTISDLSREARQRNELISRNNERDRHYANLNMISILNSYPPDLTLGDVNYVAEILVSNPEYFANTTIQQAIELIEDVLYNFNTPDLNRRRQTAPSLNTTENRRSFRYGQVVSLINTARRINQHIINPIDRPLWNRTLDQALITRLNDIHT